MVIFRMEYKFPIAKLIFPEGNVNFPIVKLIVPARDVNFPIVILIFSEWNINFPKGKLIFPERKINIPLGNLYFQKEVAFFLKGFGCFCRKYGFPLYFCVVFIDLEASFPYPPDLFISDSPAHSPSPSQVT